MGVGGYNATNIVYFMGFYRFINICIFLIYKHITYFTALSVSFGNRNKPTLKIDIHFKRL